MKTIIALEEAAMTAIAFYFISQLHISFSWWLYPFLFLSPDMSALGYIVNNKVGAVSYNLFHHKGIAILVGVLGIVLKNEYWMFAGLMLFAHSSFDRMLGYGLKTYQGFGFTHLGLIGRQKRGN